MNGIIYSHTQRAISFGPRHAKRYGTEPYSYAIRHAKGIIHWCNSQFIGEAGGSKAEGGRAHASAWTDAPAHYAAQFRVVMDTECFALWKIHAQLMGWHINQAIREHLGLPALGAGELLRVSKLHCGKNSFGVGGDTLTLAECEALKVDWRKRYPERFGGEE